MTDYWRFQVTRNGSSEGRFWGIDIITYEDEHGVECDYMTRIWFWKLRLHIFHSGDPARHHHDHPFWFITIPLRSYVEEVATVTGCRIHTHARLVRRFIPHFRPANHKHKVLGRYWPVNKMYHISSIGGFFTKDKVMGKKGRRRVLLGYLSGKRGTDSYRRVNVPTIVIFGPVKRDWGFWKTGYGKNGRAVCFIPHGEYAEKKDQPCG